MLPIANRKTLEVPHGLAALAAVVCLVLAFATDHRAEDRELHAQQTRTQAPVEQVAEEGPQQGQNVSNPNRERREQRQPGSLTLTPWLPVPGGGR